MTGCDLLEETSMLVVRHSLDPVSPSSLSPVAGLVRGPALIIRRLAAHVYIEV